MAIYDLQEVNLPNEEGKRSVYPRIRLTGQETLDDLSENICHATSFTPGDVKGLICALTQAMASSMSMGQSVKIEGLGVFTPKLGWRKGKAPEPGKEGSIRPSLYNICLDGIHFKPDKKLLDEMGKHCRLERAEWKFQKSSTRYTPEQRLKLAQDYLEENAFMTVADYCQLTGLTHPTAARELKEWREQEGTGIGTRGSRTHKVYVKKE